MIIYMHISCTRKCVGKLLENGLYIGFSGILGEVEYTNLIVGKLPEC